MCACVSVTDAGWNWWAPVAAGLPIRDGGTENADPKATPTVDGWVTPKLKLKLKLTV